MRPRPSSFDPVRGANQKASSLYNQFPAIMKLPAWAYLKNHSLN
jgi:hypothetical protein